MTLSLVEKRLEIDQEMVNHLEETLALAREGKITNLLIGYTTKDLEFFTISSYIDFITTLGLAEMIKLDFAREANFLGESGQ